MNERIRQLALQAGLGEHLWLDIADSEDITVTKKFAELIIQECSDLFEVEYGKSEVTGNEVARVLKQHFGVE